MKRKRPILHPAAGAREIPAAGTTASTPAAGSFSPPDNLLLFEQSGHRSFSPGTRRCPDQLPTDLLARNEEMIEQLRFERQSTTGTEAFITGMIGQHEKAAGLLRIGLAGQVSAAAGGRR